MSNIKLPIKISISVISLILYIFIMILIVNYSLENAEQSNATSSGITEVIEETIETVTSNKIEVDKEMLSKYVREVIGHFGLFAISAMFGFLGFIFIFKKQYINVLLIMFIGINLSLLTELIQDGVEGRVFDVKDILINISGVVFGIIVSKLLSVLIIRIANKNQTKVNICK